MITIIESNTVPGARKTSPPACCSFDLYSNNNKKIARDSYWHFLPLKADTKGDMMLFYNSFMPQRYWAKWIRI